MPASRPSQFSELPRDLLQRVAALLGDEDRLAMLDVCGSWAAAIEAAPALWPTAVLALGPSALNELGLRQADFGGIAGWGHPQSVCMAVDNVFDAIDSDRNAAVGMMDRAAALSPRCRRVRVQGDERVQPSVVLGLLSVLPLSIFDLELDIPCAGPLSVALTRFRQLQQLSLRTGGLAWRGLGGSFVMRRLVQLALDYRQQPVWEGDCAETTDFQHAEVLPLESSLAADLSGATRLSSLELRIKGAQHLLAVCNALPALRELRLDLYWCKTAHAQQAVDALVQLPALAVSLGIHSYRGTEATAEPLDYPDATEWGCTELPPLAGLHVTALCLLGSVSLPPDMLQLEHLCFLEVNSLIDDAAWGDDAWSSLAQLSQLKARDTVLPDATKLAAAPRLSEVHLPDAPPPFRAQLAALRPDMHITPGMSAEAAE